MKFNNVRILVKDFAKCFNFYKNQLGLEPVWGDENSGYASFNVAAGIEGIALFVSDWMAPTVSNIEKAQPANCREKMMIVLEVKSADESYKDLKAKDVKFINEPTDMPNWGARVVHLYDPEENLIELFQPLPKEKWGTEILEEDRKF